MINDNQDLNIKISRGDYTIKANDDKNKTVSFNLKEIEELIKSSALLTGLSLNKKYSNRMITPIANWTYPKSFKLLSSDQVKEIRSLLKIEIDGEDCPNPISSFKAMKFPSAILRALEKMSISHPTPIQVQGLPCVLTGRDMLAIASTGSGKSLVFILPAIMLSLNYEIHKGIKAHEGPLVFIIVPSRELAIQIHDQINFFVKYLLKDNTDGTYFPLIRSLICIGGVDIRYQIEDIQKGCHIVIGTPGRLSDLIEKRKLSPSSCKLLVLDEADRLLDMGFDDEIKKVLDKMRHPKQTLILSSTMPKKIQEHVKGNLYKPITLNIGRAGAASINVIQEIEFVKDEAKLTKLLESLQKTAPPVLIFCENKNDVDGIHEYLLLKGIDVCSIHGDKDQEDRIRAMREFRAGLKDVLVATDIVSKGLHFPEVEHVINYDMPREIENYVLRIGRTGRVGKEGLATTYINRNQDEAVLLDLKHLLIESNQSIPGFLLAINEEDKKILDQECEFCGGLGHEIGNCHKLMSQRMKLLQSMHN